ncbi:DNA polymerase III subunit delta' [Kurthia zopfii]|uniref:DNA polymerase III subunit delta' n=1 Tax=Kurthia zopfii TaxID=1650 RepID=A0A8B4Q587_9BACL|nr:DNA polymerase III subunit delta' [Kurthia zopfii]PWI21085.1 DNA polymerase III subunit delta' [Kurthia zopfii]TDR32114.1 DNA polymerase-3 subunit delta' [Kurthia zopfii]GEK32376.1 DNA polymerase III subunit delta' [Kurthia zopfii]STX08398.1 DNA polymerase III subunit delta' [Kurthia zopfii]
MQYDVALLKDIQPNALKQLQSIYKNGKVGHAYIFEGTKGSGVEEMMRYFTQLLLCEHPIENVPCETCRSCARVKSGNHLNYLEVHPDGQFIKVDAIETLLDELSKKGLEAGRKVYVVYESERLNVKSANKLLKILEEPDGLVTAIFLTKNINAIIPTIRSRCQHIKFQPVSRKMMIMALQEQQVTHSVASTLSMVTANLDEAITLSQDDEFALARKTVLKLVEAISINVHEALLVVHEYWLPTFKEKEQVELALDLLLFAIRDIVTIKANSDGELTYPDMKQVWTQMALNSSYNSLSAQLQAILKARQQLQSNMNRTLLMEQLMLDLQEGKSFV